MFDRLIRLFAPQVKLVVRHIGTEADWHKRKHPHEATSWRTRRLPGARYEAGAAIASGTCFKWESTLPSWYERLRISSTTTWQRKSCSTSLHLFQSRVMK